MNINVIKSNQTRTTKRKGPVPITYFEATRLYQIHRAPFSFIHFDPIDGESDGKMVMIEPAHFIRAELWDTFQMTLEDRD